MRLMLFEDAAAPQFGPLSLTRPVFELLCGHFSLRERLLRRWNIHEWGVLLRNHLAETYREQHPEAHVNQVEWLQAGPTLFVNGRWLPDPRALAAVGTHEAGFIGETLVYLTLDPEEAVLLSRGDWESALAQAAQLHTRVPTTGIVLEHPWDLVQHNPLQIAEDFAARGFGEQVGEFCPQVALLGRPEWINIDRAAQIDPFVVIDARKGPVSIEAGTLIQPFTRLEGPCHIGRGSQLFRANLRGGTTLGPQCRIGGEVEASIVQGYSNKYHDGFLGHSYVGSWVNLGAQTTNSDLKNDYSPVSVPLHGTPVDTGLSKVGCFIGDHTKTALGSLFNTGSSIGVMCTILPGGELLPKHVPSFASVWHGELAPGLAFERLLAAARTAMQRRNCELTAAQGRLWQHLFHITRREREDAIDRSREKRARPELTVRQS